MKQRVKRTALIVAAIVFAILVVGQVFAGSGGWSWRTPLLAQGGIDFCAPADYVPMPGNWPTAPGWYRWERPKSFACDQVGEWEYLGPILVLRLGPTTITECQIDEGWRISPDLVRFPANSCP